MLRKLATGLLCISVITAGIQQLKAQQLPQYSQYMFNTLEINPAYAGFKQSMQFTSIFRKQFNGIKDAPQTALLSFDMPIGDTKLGYGVKLVDDRISVSRTMGGSGFHVVQDRRRKLKPGFRASGRRAEL